MHEIVLTDEELTDIRELVEEAGQICRDIEAPGFLDSATTFAQELPRRLRSELNAFRLNESHGACIIRGFRVDDTAIGPTPGHWKDRNPARTLSEDLYFMLCGCLLGDPIGWATQQDGRIMHDILPIRENEYEQLGSGSKELLTWHTEDAFHPLRTDYLGLFCLRNPDGVETTYASVLGLEIPEGLRRVLSEDLFPIRPDRSHLPQNRGSAAADPDAMALLERSYEWIQQLDDDPERVAVLFGDVQDPYLRLDPYFMNPEVLSADARHAVESLERMIDAQLSGIAASPGDVVLIDNYKSVHGRRSFQARYDGTDRWLKRLNIARDLRRSRAHRLSAGARVMY